MYDFFIFVLKIKEKNKMDLLALILCVAIIMICGSLMGIWMCVLDERRMEEYDRNINNDR